MKQLIEHSESTGADFAWMNRRRARHCPRNQVLEHLPFDNRVAGKFKGRDFHGGGRPKWTGRRLYPRGHRLHRRQSSHRRNLQTAGLQFPGIRVCCATYVDWFRQKGKVIE